MANYVPVTSVSSATSGSLFTLADGDDFLIPSGVTVAKTANSGIGIDAVGSYHHGIVQGTIFADWAGVSLGQNGTQTNLSLEIDAGGQVFGMRYGAVQMYGSAFVVDNAGLIYSSYQHGIQVYSNGTGTGTSTVTNSGRIFGGTYGINNVSGTTSEKLGIDNSGTIEGKLASIYSESFVNQAEKVTNTGKLVGAVFLAGGNDLIDTSKGTVQGTIDLGAGNDTAYGSAAADTVRGGSDNDTIRGNGGNDKLYGDAGKDTIDGGSGNDSLTGGDDTDTIVGGTGNDTLIGGLGKDKLTGGTGTDYFRFASTPSSTNIDTITDFKHGEDKIQLDDAIFAALGSSITSDEFGVKSSGHTASDKQHIIYDKSNGTLWYDADDNGSGAAKQIAQLGTSASHPTNLTYSDFAIV